MIMFEAFSLRRKRHNDRVMFELTISIMITTMIMILSLVGTKLNYPYVNS